MTDTTRWTIVPAILICYTLRGLSASIPHTPTTDICKLDGKVVRMYCNCEPTDYLSRQIDCTVQSLIDADNQIWNSFVEQTRLERLTLASRPVGELRYIPAQAVNSSAVLKKVHIRYGALGNIHRNAFHRSPKLASIDLQDNGIHVLEHHAFTHLPSLEDLTLSNNDIKEIKSRTIHDLPTLRSLYLDRNRLHYIEPGAFSQGLPLLSELELANNALVRLEKGVFHGLKGLRCLELAENQLSRLGPDSFGELPSLNELILRDNVIEELDGDTFRGLSGLLFLDLAGNKLTRLPENGFTHTPSLLRLDLKRNQLRALPEAVVMPLRILSWAIETTNRTRVLLRENPLECDCNTRWMLEDALLRKKDPTSEWQQVTCIMKNETTTTTQRPNNANRPGVTLSFDHHSESHVDILSLSLDDLVCNDNNSAQGTRQDIHIIVTTLLCLATVWVVL